jgi:putative transposase
MRQSRFTVEEIMRIIAESELPTTSIAGTARKYGIKEATLYRWRARYKDLSTSEAKRLKVLEDENRRFKRLVADKELIIQTLNETLKKTFDSRPEAAGDPGTAATRDLPATGPGPG